MSKKISIIAMLIMAIVSFSNFFGYSLAGISIVIGVVFFFVTRSSERNIATENVLDRSAISKHLKDQSIWFWITLPLIMNIICFALAMLFLPAFIDHIYSRTEMVVSVNTVMLLILQLAFLAFGEEIAWRGFFQKQLSEWLPIIPVLLLTSILFSLAHFAVGSIVVVSYDIFFIFINSVLYGIVFYKTNNVYISAMSHFIANLFASIILFFL